MEASTPVPFQQSPSKKANPKSQRHAESFDSEREEADSRNMDEAGSNAIDTMNDSVQVADLPDFGAEEEEEEEDDEDASHPHHHIDDLDSPDSLDGSPPLGLQAEQQLLRKHGLLPDNIATNKSDANQSRSRTSIPATASLTVVQDEVLSAQHNNHHEDRPEKQQQRRNAGVRTAPRPSFESIFGEGFDSPTGTDNTRTNQMTAVEGKDKQIQLLRMQLIAAKDINQEAAMHHHQQQQEQQQEPTHVGSTDERDRKIVEMAKKCRTLTMSLNRLRAHVATLEVQNKIQSINVAQSRSAPTITVKQQEQQHQKVSRDKANQMSLRDATARLDTQRQKTERLAQENRRMRHVLIAEVGQEEEVDRLLSAANNDSKSNWKGRAQRIVVLKSKLKHAERAAHQMQQELTGTSFGGGNSSGSGGAAAIFTAMASAGPSTTGRRTVDDKAASEIRELERERRQSVDRIAKNNQELDEKNNALKKKLLSAKARIVNLEKENIKTRKSLKLVMEKSADDDRLIEGIRSQLSSAKALLMQQESMQASMGHDSAVLRKARDDLLARMRNADGELQREQDVSAHLRHEVQRLRQQVIHAQSTSNRHDMEAKIRSTGDSVLSVENERLKELVDMLSREQAKVEEECADANAQLLDAKRKLRQQAQRTGVQTTTHKRRTSQGLGGNGKVAPESYDDTDGSSAIRMLKETLRFETEENEALKASVRAALVRKDQEIALLRKAVKETRKYCDDAVAMLKRTHSGGDVAPGYDVQPAQHHGQEQRRYQESPQQHHHLQQQQQQPSPPQKDTTQHYRPVPPLPIKT